MKRLTWGIVLLVFGLLSLIGAGSNPQGTTPSIVVGVLFIIGGGWLAYAGAAYRARRRAVVNAAFQMLREKEAIHARDLADATGVSEIEVREHLADAQRRGLIPIKAEVL